MESHRRYDMELNTSKTSEALMIKIDACSNFTYKGYMLWNSLADTVHYIPYLTTGTYTSDISTKSMRHYCKEKNRDVVF